MTSELATPLPRKKRRVPSLDAFSPAIFAIWDKVKLERELLIPFRTHSQAFSTRHQLYLCRRSMYEWAIDEFLHIQGFKITLGDSQHAIFENLNFNPVEFRYFLYIRELKDELAESLKLAGIHGDIA